MIVIVFAIVNVPNQQPARRKLRVEPHKLTILDQKILRVRFPLRPQTVDGLLGVLYWRQGECFCSFDHSWFDPTQPRLGPRTKVCGGESTVVPTPRPHNAPHAD